MKESTETMRSEPEIRMKRQGVLLRQDSYPESQQDQFMEWINRLARRPLRPEQVYIRSMYLCSDRLCAQDWGRFNLGALEQICKMIIGQSVIVGHDRSRLPIARFFYAEIVQRKDDLVDELGEPVHWVRAWFYWLKDTQGARDLMLNIDGGIYREVSISWRYRLALCSICGKSIQDCSHVPGKFYGERRCTFTIEEIAEVLEGSIVYKGAETRTGFGGSHQSEMNSRQVVVEERLPLRDPENLERYRIFLDRQSRCIRSLLVVTDCPEDTFPLFWLGKQSGLQARGWIVGEAVSVQTKLGGIDWQTPGAFESGCIDPDLLWIRLRNPENIQGQEPWWKRLCQQVRFCLWDVGEDVGCPLIRKDLLRKYFHSPPWQIRTVGEPEAGQPIELVREAL